MKNNTSKKWKSRITILISIILLSTMAMIVAQYWQNGFRLPVRMISSEEGTLIPYLLVESDPLLRERQMKQRILQHLTLSSSTEGFNLQLGGFALQNNQSICDLFPTLEIRWRAEGVAINGEPPSIILTQDCQASNSEGQIGPFAFYTRQIMEWPPEDQTQTIMNQNVRIQGLDGFWPPDWHLYKVTFKNIETGEFLEIDSYEINFVRGGPVALSIDSR